MHKAAVHDIYASENIVHLLTNPRSLIHLVSMLQTTLLHELQVESTLSSSGWLDFAPTPHCLDITITFFSNTHHHFRVADQWSTTNLFFFRHRPKRFWNDRKKFSHFGQNVWKYRLKTLLWRVLMQQWDKWPKCFSKKKPSDEYEQSWRQSAQQRRPGHIASGTYPTTGPCSLASRVSRPSNCCGICAGAAAHTGGKRDYFRSNKR